MSRPQLVPLVLLSEYVLVTNINDGVLTALPTTTAARLRNGLQKASAYVQRQCNRRFDEFLDVRKYTALDERVGGALNGPYILQLDAELREVTPAVDANGTTVSTILNGDGMAITSGYKLIHYNSDIGVQTLTRVHLNVFSGIIWRSGGVDPWEAIQVPGTWGYGGQWLDSGTTLTTDSGASLTVSSGTPFEVGMTLKLDDEYLYVEAVSTNTLTVDRAMNGSVQATHAGATKVYVWEALDSVRDLVIRLTRWKQEQQVSPLVGTGTVGDFSFPVDISGLPKDLYLAIRDLQLARTENAQGV